MQASTFRTAAAIAIILAAGVPSALAELERVGPTDPVNGFPRWYQDKTGIAFEFGAPLNQAELDGGWLLISSADVPSGTAPETFPTDFAGEHFYWAADARIDFVMPDGEDGRALLVLAMEAAFAIEVPVPGDQVVFGRLRIRMDDVPFDGTYTVYTPYGVRTFPDQVAGERLFHTEDVGIGAPGDFTGALTSSIAPFLLPSNTPGGSELPPVSGPVPDKLYICNPGREGPVTGSPLPPFVSPLDGQTRNHNIFRIEGPNGFVLQTTSFTMSGRLYTGPMPGRVTIDRASYIRTAADLRTEVYATGLPTRPSRLPAAPVPALVLPLLSYFNAPPVVDPGSGGLSPPAGQTEVTMASNGKSYWGQSQPPTLPAGVTVKDANTRNATGQVAPVYFGANVTDEIAIDEAYYDPSNGGSLRVKARSSDSVSPPTLTLVDFGPLVNNGILVSTVAAPPAVIRVLSSAGGANERHVSTLLLPPPTPPLAVDDAAATQMDTPVIVAVLSNDTIDGTPIVFGAGVQVTIVDAPELGTAEVGVDGTISYTPNPGLAGSDLFFYTVTVNGGVSCPAAVTITINSPPVAEGQTIAAIAGEAQIIMLTATDDGPLPLTFAIATPPANGTLGTLNPKTGVVTYTPNLGATDDSFTFTASDAAGLTSTPAVISITISQPNSAPVAQDQAVSVTEGVAKTFNLAATDDDGPPPLTFAIVTPPANGALCLLNPETGLVSYTPNSGATSDSFTFIATDGLGAASTAATVSINVTPPNQQPVADPQSIIAVAGVTTAFTLTASDPDGPPPLTFAIATPPANGTLDTFDPAAGAGTYTPSAGATSDSFTFTATDGAGAISAAATVSITIAANLRADFNKDAYVDPDDLAVLVDCASGPTITADPVCVDADFDSDQDVDQDDFGVFQRCYSGPLLPDPTCAD